MVSCRLRSAVSVTVFLALLLGVVPGASVDRAAAATSTIVVAAEVPGASELGPAPGIFRFTRTGDLSTALTVAFVLSGTATTGVDYLVWESSARFDAGADTARVTILPRNDASSEAAESVILDLTAGAGYTIGAPARATVTIQDAFTANRPGILDPRELDPSSGLPLVQPDITYLETTIDRSQGLFLAAVEITNPSGFGNNLAIFLDTDQNPATGDYRPGHVAGQEYLIDTDASFIFQQYTLYRLRTEPPDDPALERPEDDIAVHTGTPVLSGNALVIPIPLQALGNPTAVDVFAISHRGSLENTSGTYRGTGDRSPNFGALDTASGQVVVRRPAPTRFVQLADPTGDVTQLAFDVDVFAYAVIADQVEFFLQFTTAFDPTRATLAPGPWGAILVDSDRNILTGGRFMGDEIPTWGGDMELFFNVSAQRVPGVLFELHPDAQGNALPFGQKRNDGRWLGFGNQLVMTSSLSVFDAFVVRPDEHRFERVPTDGRMIAQVTTLNQTFLPGDSVPNGKAALDGATGATVQPLSWNGAQRVSEDDPRDIPGDISGGDIIKIDAAVIANNLVIQGTFASWLNTDVDNIVEIALDTDGRVATAPFGLVPATGQPPIGTDYVYGFNTGASSLGNPTTVLATLQAPDTSVRRIDATIRARPQGQLGAPGTFTVTIPLAALGNVGPRPRFYILASKQTDAGPVPSDLAPPRPFVIPLRDAPAADVSPTSLTFGSQPVGTTSAAQSVTVQNSGSAPLAIQGIQVSGDFASTTSCGSTLPAGGRCTIEVTFSPTAAGQRSGQLTIADNTPDSPRSIALTGTATAGAGPTLTVTRAGSGSGTVTSDPVGIVCGPDCSEAFAAGQPVTLAAAPEPGSTFVGWSGACTGTGACQVTLNGPTTVTATFARANAGVQVGRAPGLLPNGDPVLAATLTARPGCGGIERVQFGAQGMPFDNARVSVTAPAGGPTGQTSGFAYTPPPGTMSVTLTIERVAPTGGATVSPIEFVDGCGVWKTFVGAGPAAFT